MDDMTKFKIVASLVASVIPLLGHGFYENSNRSGVPRILTAWCWIAFAVALVVVWL
jgi:hypothetical protein